VKAGQDVTPALERRIEIAVNRNKVQEGQAGLQAHGVQPQVRHRLYAQRRHRRG
jgi:hypothetical protein